MKKERNQFWEAFQQIKKQIIIVKVPTKELFINKATDQKPATQLKKKSQ